MGAIPEMMVSVGETPWHRQGLVLPDDTVLTPASAYAELGGLDSHAIVKSTMIDSQTYDPIPGRFLLKREITDSLHDKMIGTKPQIVSDRYEIIQNREIVDLVDELVCLSLRLARCSTPAWLGCCWTLASRLPLQAPRKLPTVLVLLRITVLATCCLCCDGAGCVSEHIWPVKKTGNMRWSIRHSSSAQDRLVEAREGLERAYRAMDDMDRDIIELLDRPFRESQWELLVDEIQPEVQPVWV